MTRYHSAKSGTVVRTFCAVCAALVLAGMSRVVFSQSAGVALPANQRVGELAGKVGSQRAYLIATIAPQLRAGLTAQEAAEILGTPAELSEGSRRSAITSIARAKKLGPLGAESALMLKATTVSTRAFAIGELAPYLKANLTAQEAADILGTPAELSEGSRRSAGLGPPAHARLQVPAPARMLRSCDRCASGHPATYCSSAVRTTSSRK